MKKGENGEKNANEKWNGEKKNGFSTEDREKKNGNKNGSKKLDVKKG